MSWLIKIRTEFDLIHSYMALRITSELGVGNISKYNQRINPILIVISLWIK
jgi:hypothetical protein